MYFDFEDHRPETPTVGSPISRREGVLLSIIVHLLLVVLILVYPNLPFVKAAAREAARQEALARQAALERQQAARTFVFVQPRLDMPAPRPPERGPDSDQDRRARAPERAPNPRNLLPFARGNTPERVEAQRQQYARGQGPLQNPGAGQTTAQNDRPSMPASDVENAVLRPQASDATGRGSAIPGGGSLGEALRNLQKFVQQDSFGNEQGGGGAFGPSIQFDTMGVEFGPWIRRFIAQIKRNWFVPYAAMSLKGHVVVTFYVHKDGAISALGVAAPSSVESFNHAAFNALASSNPTQPLPPEYPSESAFFTVTFYYNETPPSPTP